MNTITSLFLSLPQALAPTQVGVSTECANGSLQRSPVLALRAGRCVPPHMFGSAPLSSSLAAKGSPYLVAVSPECVSDETAAPVSLAHVRALRAGESSVGHEGSMRVDAANVSGKEGAMTRPDSVLNTAVLALADAKQRARVQLMRDGVLCDADAEVLRGMQDAMRLVEQADFGRRMAALIATTGVVTPHMLRQAREFERDFGHTELQAA